MSDDHLLDEIEMREMQKDIERILKEKFPDDTFMVIAYPNASWDIFVTEKFDTTKWKEAASVLKSHGYNAKWYLDRKTGNNVEINE